MKSNQRQSERTVIIMYHRACLACSFACRDAAAIVMGAATGAVQSACARVCGVQLTLRKFVLMAAASTIFSAISMLSSLCGRILGLALYLGISAP